MKHNYKHICEISNIDTGTPKKHSNDIGTKKSIFKTNQEHIIRKEINNI